MSEKHTSGPWSTDKWAPGWSISAPDEQYTVCTIEDCNNSEANARLIAAAPELLEACRQLVSEWDDSFAGQDTGYEGTPLDDCVKAARAAIARATE